MEAVVGVVVVVAAAAAAVVVVVVVIVVVVVAIVERMGVDGARFLGGWREDGGKEV